MRSPRNECIIRRGPTTEMWNTPISIGQQKDEEGGECEEATSKGDKKKKKTELESIMLWEINQVVKDRYYMTSTIRGI